MKVDLKDFEQRVRESEWRCAESGCTERASHVIFHPNSPRYWKVCQSCGERLQRSRDKGTPRGLILEDIKSYYYRKDWRTFKRIVKRHPEFVTEKFISKMHREEEERRETV